MASSLLRAEVKPEWTRPGRAPDAGVDTRRASTRPPERVATLGADSLAWNFGRIPVLAPGESLSSGPRSRSGLSAPRVTIQRKLEIGAADDPLEREADRAAEQVMRTTLPDGAPTTDRAHALRRQWGCGAPAGDGGECPECRRRAGTLLRKASVEPPASRAVPGIVHEVLHSPGRPLEPAVRAFMEPRFGVDFGDVRVHTDSRAAASARAVNALAYTVGRDVVFGAGQYEPSSPPAGGGWPTSPSRCRGARIRPPGHRPDRTRAGESTRNLPSPAAGPSLRSHRSSPDSFDTSRRRRSSPRP
jgi:hypothetical protein